LIMTWHLKIIIFLI